MADSLKEKTVNGVAWSAVERFTTQGIVFVFNILIARILLPEDYGVVAMLNIFFAVAQTFIDSGFASALIRKQDRSEEDFNTVFYFNVFVSLFFFVVLWIAAPWIADFYKIPVLTKIARVISLTLVVNSFGAIQWTRLSIDLDFRTRAIVSIIRCIIIGVLGLAMAMRGYGVWALVAQNVVGSVVSTILVCVFVRWIPRLVFSWKAFKEMFSFGSKLLATSLIDTVWGNLYTLVIGRVFSSASLGVYNRAESFATFPSANIYGMIQGVIYPSLCKVQDETERLRSAYQKFIKLSSYIVFPMMFGLAAVADPFIRLILTDAWADAIPILKILCFVLVLYPLNAVNITFPNIKGHSEMYLKAAMINKVFDVIVLAICIPFGIKMMCYCRLISSIAALYVNTRGCDSLIGYGMWKQIKDILHVIVHSVIMFLLVSVVVALLPGNALRLGAGVACGALYYIAVSYVLGFEEFETVLTLVLSRLKNQ